MAQNLAKFATRFNRARHVVDYTLAEYIWIDGSGQILRGKTKCLPKICNAVEDFPVWDFDGSSTGQAVTKMSEIKLKPVAVYPDPFRRTEGQENAYLVFCETYEADEKTPAQANFRYYAKKIMEEAQLEKPWFGWEQEYILMSHEGFHFSWPLGFPKGGYAKPQKQYFCGIGPRKAIGRYVAEAHLQACLAAGILISGINAEVFPSQWEFQVGPGLGIKGCDELWVARYLLERVAEEFDLEVTYEPKPVKGDWNGSGCHCNVSLESTRNEGGLTFIKKSIKELEKRHRDHIPMFGDRNDERLTGEHETASINEFTSNVADRSATVRIGMKTAEEKKGYFEDRRPAGNCDPYLVAGSIIDTIALGGKHERELTRAFKEFKKRQGSP